MKKIDCTDRFGMPHEFYYCSAYDELDREWVFKVYDKASIDGPDSGCFELHYKPLNEKVWQQTGIYHNSIERYRAKGIPDTMLLEISREHGVLIVSSPSSGESDVGSEGVWRSQEATRMWQRLVTKGLAVFKNADGIFVLQNPQQ